MIGQGGARTGIDLGATSVKLVRGTGDARLQRITHYGLERLEREPAGEETQVAAVKRLMDRLGLKRADLGRLAIAMSAEQASVREVTLPELTEAQLAGALRFEARKHLNLEQIADEEQGEPVVAFQMLGAVAEAAAGAREMRVLFAGVSRSRRQVLLEALLAGNLEPDVIDLEALAGLNALFACRVQGDAVLALLDLGAHHASVHVSGRRGGFFSRSLTLAAPSADEGREPYAERLRDLLRETLTFYRGRFRRPIAGLYLSGGGAALAGLPEALRGQIDGPVEILDPLGEFAAGARTAADAAAHPARFAVACGVCRWWDEPHV
ncbi:MAG: pilus assembly protein PilM [Candidatus Eisenbacteria bacterium]|nr:pilus assembly protein PilM [Candidatus Eisenbacteria bacterium]